MFMDFIGDCVEEELVTGNPSYKQLREFIEKWVEDHFPFNLAYAKEIDSVNLNEKYDVIY